MELKKPNGATNCVRSVAPFFHSPNGQGKWNIFPVKQVNKDVRINMMRRRWEN
ncbi:hypothetical protein EDO6_05626 [Paenibacillus xylanexedens]|nr:hypothetical protein EDO6_05626 [Paenibacillus xylanexedens]